MSTELEESILNFLRSGMSYKEISLELKNRFNVDKTEKSIRSFCFRKNEKSSKYFIGSKIVNKCLNCDAEILDLKSASRKFCSRSCSATFNNANSEKGNWRKKKDRECLDCGKLVRFKYCNSECQRSFERKFIFSQIENGDTSFSHRLYKKYLIHKYGEKCMDCSWSSVNRKTNKIPINLEHIDGNSKNNKLENLKLLCPNCHSLTETYGSLNNGNGRSERQNYRNYIRKLELEELINELSIVRGDSNREFKIKEKSVIDRIELYKRYMKIKNRPSLNELLKNIESIGYRGTGRIYGVSDNCIRKWIEKYKKNGENWLKDIVPNAIG